MFAPVLVCLAIKEDKSQYTSKIDAPVERESELYGVPTRA